MLRISLCEIRSSSFCGLYFSTLESAEERQRPLIMLIEIIIIIIKAIINIQLLDDQ